MTSFSPQLLVDDLDRSIAYRQRLGFTFGEPWDGFYAIGDRDGLELHLKEAPKNPAERRYRRDNPHLRATPPNTPMHLTAPAQATERRSLICVFGRPEVRGGDGDR